MFYSIRHLTKFRYASAVSESVMEARMHADGKGLLVKTREPDKFYLQLNKIAMNGIGIESVTPAPSPPADAFRQTR